MTDAIQIPIADEPLDAQFQFGSFVWTDVNSLGNTVLKQVKICNSREFYDRELQQCTSCPDDLTGTTEFQQTRCKSCGDIWFRSRDAPQSLEGIVSNQLCERPEFVYLEDNPLVETLDLELGEVT